HSPARSSDGPSIHNKVTSDKRNALSFRHAQVATVDTNTSRITSQKTEGAHGSARQNIVGRIHGIKASSIGQLDIISRRDREGAAHIHFGVRPKNDAGGIDKKQIGTRNG